MMSVLPKLEDFDIFPSSGFLPQEFPLTELPQPIYRPWENLVKNLPSLILTRRVRSIVDKCLDVLPVDELRTKEEYRRAYQTLSFLAHAYIWGDEHPTSRLPEQIAKPLLTVADKLGLPPLATYASLCLWNFKQIIETDDDSNAWDLDNLTTINTFTGSIDESWFYLVSVHFEYKGSFVLNKGLEALRCVEQKNTAKLVDTLQLLAQAIDHLGSVMMRMEEMCDPHVFYYRIRPFLAGWTNMSDVGLDKGGVIYGDESKPRAYAGGSNAQSSMIQFLDILLGITHHSTGDIEGGAKEEKKPSQNAFINEMQNYMPGEHRQFLRKIKEVANIREYVMQQADQSPELILSYDACLAMLKSFRDKHIQIVTRYIVLQAKKNAKLGSSSTMRSGLAKSKKKGSEEKGTGGTSLLPFLKQCRDETGSPAAGSWGKRLLSDGMMRLKYSRPNAVNEDE